jgi:hypothetical protein
METATKYIKIVKSWSSKHPLKAAFVFGFIVGFIIKAIL